VHRGKGRGDSCSRFLRLASADVEFDPFKSASALMRRLLLSISLRCTRWFVLVRSLVGCARNTQEGMAARFRIC